MADRLPGIAQVNHADFEGVQEALMLLIKGAVSEPEALRDAINHHFSAGGRRIRLHLALDSGSQLGLPFHDRKQIALACELIHNASLIHDDIQDQATERRGQASVWKVYGVNIALCAGDFLLSLAFQQLAHTQQRPVDLIEHFHRRTRDLIQGQALDLVTTEQDLGVCDLETYRQIARGKSGALLALPYELTLLSAGLHDSMAMAREAGEAFACAYQIMDDLEDCLEDASRGALNWMSAVSELSKNELVASAILEAEQQCEAAIGGAQRLPAQSGRMLSEHATQMLQQLDHLRQSVRK